MVLKGTLLALLSLCLPLTAVADDPLGVWQTQDRDGHVRIQSCEANTLCGTLVWFDPNTPVGLTDGNNPDPILRGRALIGIQILSDLPASTESREMGRIYNPYDGKTFRARIELQSNQTLEVTGCWRVICRSNIWHRVSN